MLDWAVVLVGTVLGVLVLFRPRLLGLPDSFHGSTLLGLTLLTIGLTAPLVLRPEQMMLESGAETDAFIGTWNLWWTAKAILSGHSPYFTDLLFAPEGTDLSLHTHAVTEGTLFLPVLGVFGMDGPPGIFGVYNCIVFVSFLLTAYFAYRLALTLTAHRDGSLLAGLVVGFSNFRFANTVRLHVLSMEWLVLLVWMWVLLWRAPRAARWLGVAVAGVLLANASLELTAYAAVVLVAWTVVELAGRYFPKRGKTGVPHGKAKSGSGTSAGTGKSTRSGGEVPIGSKEKSAAAVGTSAGAWASILGKGAWGPIAAVVVGLLGTAPLLVRLLRRLGDRPAFEPRLAEHFSADLLDFIIPNPRHPIWGSGFARQTARLHLGDDGFGQSIGIVVLVLFVGAGVLIFRNGRGRRWWIGAVACLLLALGPTLHIAGQSLGIPMPQKILSAIVPILGQSRTPIRWMAPASLCIGMSIAWGWAALRSSSEARRLDPAAIGAFVLLLVTMLAAPMQFTEEPIPDVYHYVADASNNGGLGRATLLHLPGMLPREALLYQTIHGQRMVEDVSPAIPLHDAKLIALTDPRYTILVRELARPGALAALGTDGLARAAADLRAYLEQFEIRWIIVPSGPQYHEWALGSLFPKSVHGRPIYDAYRENLRLLRPVEELEMQGFTVFRF
ncbi:MAG: hypothetical protein R3E97_20075 [Candidatus Eisenbacteria bacterium]